MAAGEAYQRYILAIQKMEHHTREKEIRIASLEKYYRSTGRDQATIDILVDRDIDVNKQASKAARWAGVAAAYGPGAVIEAITSLRGVIE